MFFTLLLLTICPNLIGNFDLSEPSFMIYVDRYVSRQLGGRQLSAGDGGVETGKIRITSLLTIEIHVVSRFNHTSNFHH